VLPDFKKMQFLINFGIAQVKILDYENANNNICKISNPYTCIYYIINIKK